MLADPGGDMLNRLLFFLFPLLAVLFFASVFIPALRARVQGILVWGGVLFLVVVGLLPLLIGLRSIWRGLASAHWPTVPATVLQAGVSATEGKDQRGRSSTTMYSADLTFGYQVDGRNYSTETVQFGKALGSGDPSEAAVLMLHYPPGSRVEVRHHPADPALATVKPGVNAEVVLYLIAGLAFLVFGAVAGLGYLSVTRELHVGRYAFSLAWLIMILLGVGMLVPGLRNLWHAYVSPSWPKARGVIVFAEPTDEGAETQVGERGALRSTAHGAPLAYQYEVGGKQHFSNVRRFGQFGASTEKEWAEEILERYPSGADVPVSYCPADPDLATLEPGIGRETYYLPGAGAAFLLFGLLAMLLTWRRMS
jgi:hypothetical protein